MDKTLDLKEILACIGSWNTLRNEKNELVINSLFDAGNSFSYNRSKLESAQDSFIHVYPGVKDGKLLLFVIDADKDNAQEAKNPEEILAAITVCELDHMPELGSEIPTEEALERIKSWKDNRIGWVKKQVETEEGIFQAFVIPSSDLQPGQESKVYFALKPNPDGENAFADLIIDDMQDNSNDSGLSKYFDLVRPVPPFHIDGPLEKENFYLLEIS